MVTTIRLSPDDNIVVLAGTLKDGEGVRIGNATFGIKGGLGLGHKLACRPIHKGEKIFKYGVPIGSATKDIAAGEHVHLQNMKSDYLPTYTLEAEHQFKKTS